MICASPRAVAIRILLTETGDGHHRDSAYSLAQFQAEAVTRAERIIRGRGGVVIADDVGLGKTFIAAALIERFAATGSTTAVVIPASLVRPWRRALAPLQNTAGRLELISHGQLSRGRSIANASFVVVDEAHAFRNPATRRYRSLRGLCRSARVVLLTATPVNNSMSDLYFQLRLFLSDDALRDLGVGSLRSALVAPDWDPLTVARIRDAVVIRRSRNELRRRFSSIVLPDGQPLRFPESVTLQLVKHRPLLEVSAIRPVVENLELAAYGTAASPLIVICLLKRIQSGRAAALSSVDRMIDFHNRLLHALAQNHWLRPKSSRLDQDQLFFPELIAEPFPVVESLAETRDRVLRDRFTLAGLRVLLATSIDGKLEKLSAMLETRSPPTKTLIFSEFRDTAVAIWRALAGKGGVGLLTGNSAYLGSSRSSRWEVIRRFAPQASGVAGPPDREAVWTLVATDVLAEGLNLQDAHAVVSYDLPWNPVRLIQRAGRIDRIGSNHRAVTVCNFIPDREFDDFIGIVQTLRKKLRNVRAAVGQEAAVLEPDELDEEFLRGLAASDPGVLEPDHSVGAHFTNESFDWAEAAPTGAVAALSSTPTRVLLAFGRCGVVRRLVANCGKICDDSPGAEAILAAALRSTVYFSGAEDCIRVAIARSRIYLEQSAFAGSEISDSAGLARAVQASVGGVGLMASPELVNQADRLMKLLPGFVGSRSEALRQLRDARSADRLGAALDWLGSQCRQYPVAEGEWTLIGAIAAD